METFKLLPCDPTVMFDNLSGVAVDFAVPELNYFTDLPELLLQRVASVSLQPSSLSSKNATILLSLVSQERHKSALKIKCQLEIQRI